MLRPLIIADVEQYAVLRHQMLVDSPHAFGSSPGHDRMGSAEAVRDWLGNPERAIIGAFSEDDTTMLAAAGIMRDENPKRRHVAGIWGVFTRPEARGRGLGSAVVAGAIDVACTWPGVACVQLSVSDGSPAARHVYERLGFVPWGIEPDCLRIDGRSFSEVHMALRIA